MTTAMIVRNRSFVATIAATIAALGLWSWEADGNVQMRIGAIILGVITIVIGLVLSGVVIDTAADVGGNTKVGSFSGASAINNLIPLIYFVVVVMVAVGMIGVGTAGFIGRGPMAQG